MKAYRKCRSIISFRRQEVAPTTIDFRSSCLVMPNFSKSENRAGEKYVQSLANWSENEKCELSVSRIFPRISRGRTLENAVRASHFPLARQKRRRIVSQMWRIRSLLTVGCRDIANNLYTRREVSRLIAVVNISWRWIFKDRQREESVRAVSPYNER